MSMSTLFASILRVHALIPLLFTLAFCPADQSTAQIAEVNAKTIWYGELDSIPRVFRFVLTSSLGEDGNWEGELKSLDEGGAKFKLDAFQLNDTHLSFQLNATKAKYNGQFVEESEGERKRIAGRWSQGGAELELEFQRVETAPVDRPTEVWIGELQAGIQKLLMQFRVYSDSDGGQRVFLDSISQRAGGFKAKLKTEGDSVEIDVPSLAGKFSGKRQVGSDEIVGKWSQGMEMDLTLRKADQPLSPEIDPPKRPQNPKPPFPYEIHEVEFTNESAGVTLSGTLTIPGSSDSGSSDSGSSDSGSSDSSKRFPVAVLISGSGPQDRDETLLGHKPFWVLADYLTRRGIAVLRYDERGVGQSTGDFSTATSADFANDVASAVQFLSAHDRIDPKQIGLIGHSEGGIVAPLVASQGHNVAWIVLMAGPGVNGEQIMYSQGKLMIEAEGGSAQAVERNRLIQETTIREVKKLPPGGSIDSLVEPITEEVAAKANPEKLDNSSNETSELKKDQNGLSSAERKAISALVRANLQAMNTVWFRFFMDHEPGPVLEKVRCPVLAINGEKDTQVDPKLNLPKIEESLKRGGNQDITIVELPELNHLFQTSKHGGLSEYEAIEETIAPLAMKTIGDWIEQRKR